MKKILFLILFLGAFINQYAQKYPYQDPSVPVEQRVEDLLSRMTLDEKIDMIGGSDLGTKVNERLGIPELRMTDGPTGTRIDKSTAFPAGIATGATWNPELISEVGAAIGRELKGHGRHIILGPCVNIARMPLGGRVFESMGEDPFLSSRLVVGYINGVQSEGVAATVKHFSANNEERERHYVDELISRRALNEIYLPAFKAAVTEANSLCLMTAYNKVNGRWASENEYLLQEILRDKWNYKGLIMSDWEAVHSDVPTAQLPLDIEMPYGKYMNAENLKGPIEEGIVPEEAIDSKVRHILTLMFKLGLFEKQTVEDPSLINSDENKDVAYRSAREAITLLKNEDNILPLNKSKVKTVAVIGPEADTTRTGGGGSSAVKPIYTVSILDGLKSRLPEGVKLVYSKGIQIDDSIKLVKMDPKWFFTDESCTQNGLKADFYNNRGLSGEPALERIDSNIDYKWIGIAPGEGVAKEGYTVAWSGYLKVPKTDEYILGSIATDGARLLIDDEAKIDSWYEQPLVQRTVTLNLEKGKLYKIRFEVCENNDSSVVFLGWQKDKSELLEKAVETAKNADLVFLTVGTSDRIEAEGIDREDMYLPYSQDELIERVAAVNKNVVVVLTNGSPIVMDKWLDKVKGVVETWFLGDEQGNAIADVLLGNYNPSGKLPMTFPHKWEDCSMYNTYAKYDERTYYSDDIYVGYRYYDKYNVEPLFPFGFGLSYTTFAYSNLKVTQQDSTYYVTFDLKNTGKVKGAEVAQVYVSSYGQYVERAVKELKGFSKVLLNPGETKTITIELPKDSFAYYSERESVWKVDPGKYKIAVGSSSKNMLLQSDIEIK